MKKILNFIFLLLIACNASDSTKQITEPEAIDPASTKILFIGNSITYYNQMPAIFKSMAEAGGKNTYVFQWVQGGVVLGYFALNPIAPEVIYKTKWDYVILQDGDYHIIYPEEHQRLAGYVNSLKNLILGNNPDTKILFHMLHALKDGLFHDNVYYDYTAFTQKIIEGTTAFAKLVDLKISPVGIAWNDIVVNHPEIELYNPDNMHPTYAGSYLIACVNYSAIFKTSCVGNSFSGNLSADDARTIQTVASETVLNYDN